VSRRSRSGPGKGGVRACAVLLACIGVALALGVVARSAAEPAPSFAVAKKYKTDLSPVSVAIGDLNADGRPDLATANIRANTVSVLLNIDNGSFRPKRDYRTGRAPNSVAIRDLNGDGKPDLAIANAAANTASVLVNRGDGSFEFPQDYGTGDDPHSVVSDDLDGDGNPDLVTASLSGTVSVLLNRGDGSFDTSSDYGAGFEAFSVAIGDLNGDRRPDLAIGHFGLEDAGEKPGTAVSVLLNKGDGSFQTKRDYRVGRNPRSVAIGDLNGDRKPDLATANFEPDTVSVLINRGDGSFRAKRDYRTGRGGAGSVAIGDLNGDHKPDLVIANLCCMVSVLLNRGDGSFEAKREYAAGGSVAIGNLNGDRKPDVVTVGGMTSAVSVLINTPGLCNVQDVVRMTLAAAKRKLARVNCRVGKVSRADSGVKAGGVISQKPKFGAVRPKDAKVNLVVSRGRN
jgi:FG-GAP-like repeat/PASTA domain